jgi:surfactin synthase thioesterase subunit
MMVHASPRSTVFAVHALGLNRHAYDPVRRHLDASRRFVAVELPGHGEAPPLRQPALNAYVDHVVDEVSAQAPHGLLHLVGHSFGGVVAAMVVPRLQEKGQAVASLTLLGTPAQGGSVFLDRADAVERDGGMEAFERSTIARWFGDNPPSEWDPAIHYASHALRTQSKASISATWRALASFQGFSGLTTAPHVLCVAAEDDLSTPPGVMAQIVDAIESRADGHGQVSLKTLVKGGHLFPLTMAPEVARLLEAQWSTAEDSTRSRGSAE